MLKYKVNLLRDSRQCLLYRTSVPWYLMPGISLVFVSCRTVGTMATGPASKAARYELDMHPVETRK